MSKFSGLRASRLLDIQNVARHGPRYRDLNIQTSNLPNADPKEQFHSTKLGRPRRVEAKHRHPDYRQVTAYIKRDTYAEVRGRLFNQEREFSDLVEELLVQWLKR